MKGWEHIQCKDGVSLESLGLPMAQVLAEAQAVWKQLGQPLVVTETAGGVHSAGSRHYMGWAVDLRSRYFSQVQKQMAVQMLRERLGDEYDVVAEATHVHVEYDP